MKSSQVKVTIVKRTKIGVKRLTVNRSQKNRQHDQLTKRSITKQFQSEEAIFKPRNSDMRMTRELQAESVILRKQYK